MAKKFPVETHKRAFAKSLSWRVLATVILGTISWLVTHSWIKMGMITIIYNLIQIVIYYLHERIWDKVRWGRIKHPLSDFNLNKTINDKDKELIENQLRVLGYLD